MTISQQYYCFFLLCFFAAAVLAKNELKEVYHRKWYQKYQNYPEYCSRPVDQERRKIPPLQAKNHLLGETRILHVTAVIRHGARTPWSGQKKCWDGFWNETSSTSRWDCDLTTVMAPPDPSIVAHKQSQPQADLSRSHATGWLPDDAFFLFEKFYDALISSEPGALTNELNGTCQRGQMLLQGYEQQINNGRMLREAYAYEKGDMAHDERMRLIDLTWQKSMGNNKVHQTKQTQQLGGGDGADGRLPWDENHLYLRADDDQRTVMSGQVLLQGLFNEEVTAKFMEEGTYPHIAVHTADRKQDILDANKHVCPRLQELEEEAMNSKEFQSFNNSDQMQSLRWFAQDKLGTTDILHLLDCLMTTICTDRDLPDAVNDFDLTVARNGSLEDSMFQALAEADIRAYNLIMKYKNAQFAKLAMGPLWAEIMDNINPWLQQYASVDALPAPQFALFSGHDTTIMPLLASLDPSLWEDIEWAPYASMMIIEIHELIDGMSSRAMYKTDFAFRLMYNGKILTSRVPGCPEDAELCDVTHLKSLIDPIATRDPDCTPRNWHAPSFSSSKEVIAQAETLLSTKAGILMFFGVVIVGTISGALTTFVLLTGKWPWSRQGSSLECAVDFDDDDDEEEEARQGLRLSPHEGYGEVDEEEDDFVAVSDGRLDPITTGLQ